MGNCILKKFLFITILFCLSSCRPPEDPVSLGLVPCNPEEGWMPSPNFQRPCYEEYPFEFNIEEANALPLGEMINIALQNNPLTTQKWADASCTYGYEASRSALYPSIAITGSVTSARSFDGGFINNGPEGSTLEVHKPL